MMAACQVLWFDPAHVGRVPVDPFGEQAGPASDGWRSCPATGRGWLDPAGQWRHVCPSHQRQLVALHHAGHAGRIRWAQSPSPDSHATTK
jgi:hypothetical protein